MIVEARDATALYGDAHLTGKVPIRLTVHRPGVDEVAARVVERIFAVPTIDHVGSGVAAKVVFPAADHARVAHAPDGRVTATRADEEAAALRGGRGDQGALDALIGERYRERALPQVQRERLFGSELH
jgi:hypothetical protein